MHTIRSKARHAAWSVDAGGKNYNPFARTRSRTNSKQHDEELGIRSPVPDNHSETCVTPAQEERRHEAYKEETEEFNLPQHAQTYAARPSSNSGHADPHDFPPLPENGLKQEASRGDDTVVATDTGDHGAGKARMRKFNFGKKDDDLEKSMTTESKKSKKSAKFHKKIPVKDQFRAVVFGSWVNILLIAVPVGFAINYAHVDGKANFVVNFIAIVPLAGMLSYATEELALRVGETLGGLLNASFGNAVELIVGIQALVQGQITIVKTSLIGSMLSNLLLVMGMSFFFGGINRLEQYFNVTVAQTAASLLALCIGSLIVPTVFHIVWPNATELDNVDALSRGTAVILLVVYGCYLIFQLKSHSAMYNEPSQKVPKRKSSKVAAGEVSRGIARMGAGTAAITSRGAQDQTFTDQMSKEGSEEEPEEEPQLSLVGALVTLIVSTTLVAFCSEFMTDSISEITGDGGVSTVFVGLILLPIVGNAAEHATAVTVACKDKMDLAIGVAVGSSMQIALLVLPLIVIIGWGMGQVDMNLYFDGFQIAVLFISVLLVNYLIQDGKSHWLEGVLLMATYIIIAVAAFVYPEVTESNSGTI